MEATCCGVPPPAPPTASRATGLPPRGTSGASHTRAASRSGLRVRRGRSRSGERQSPQSRCGTGNRTPGSEGTETPRSPPGPGRAAAATCRAPRPATHRAWQSGRAAPGPPWPTHHAHNTRHHLRLGREAPQVEGATRVGRAIGPALHVAVAAEPRMAANQPDHPAPPLLHGRGLPQAEGVACRRGVVVGSPSVPAGWQVEETLSCAAGWGRGKSVLLSLTRKDQRTPRKRHPWQSQLCTYTVAW